MLLVVGILTFRRYVTEAIRVIFHGYRMPIDRGMPGSHLALYGATLLAAGSIYTGLFGIAWVLADQPVEWTGTAISSFGRFLMASGFWLLCISPDVDAGTWRLPNLFWWVVIGFCALLLSFYLGTRVSTSANDEWQIRTSLTRTYTDRELPHLPDVAPYRHVLKRSALVTLSYRTRFPWLLRKRL